MSICLCARVVCGFSQPNSDDSLFHRLARGIGIKTVRDTFHSECDTLRDEIDLRCKLNKELFLELHELNMGWVRYRSHAEYDIASVFRVSVLKLFCDQSMREKAWRSRKRGAQAT